VTVTAGEKGRAGSPLPAAGAARSAAALPPMTDAFAHGAIVCGWRGAKFNPQKEPD